MTKPHRLNPCRLLLLILIALGTFQAVASEPVRTETDPELDPEMTVRESLYLNVNVRKLLASETGPLLISMMGMDQWLGQMDGSLGEDWLEKIEGVSVLHTSSRPGNPTLMLYGQFSDEDEQRLLTLLSDSSREMREFQYRQRPYHASSWQPELLARHDQMLRQIERSDSAAQRDHLYDQMSESAYQLTALAFGPQGIMISSDMPLIHRYVDTGSQPDENWRVRNQGLVSLSFDRERVIADLDALWDVDPGNFNIPIFDYFEAMSLIVSEQPDALYVHADLEATDLTSADLIHNLTQGWLSMAAFQTDQTALTQEWLNQVRIQQQGTTLSIDLNPRLDLVHELADEVLRAQQQDLEEMEAAFEAMEQEHEEAALFNDGDH